MWQEENYRDYFLKASNFRMENCDDKIDLFVDQLAEMIITDSEVLCDEDGNNTELGEEISR